MPVAAAVGLAGVGAAASIGATIWSVVGTFVMRLAVSAVISAVQRALTPKPKAMNQGQTLQTKIDPAFAREVGVGKFATGGSLSFENVSGDDNKYLWRTIPISDAEIEEITQVRGNGEALTFDGDIHTGLRNCTSHFQAGDGTDCLAIRIYKGTSSQTADADLLAAFPSLLDSNFRGRGIAYALVRMTWNSEAWQSGVDLVFVGKGADCYDPRDASTAWSENAALVTRQYLKGWENNGIRVVGLGCSDEDLPDADFSGAADECDEDVALAAGGTEKRYVAGGMISARENAREVLADLGAAMGGYHVDVGGQVTVLPGVLRAAVMDIDEADLLADEPMMYAARRTADERVNAIVSTFVSPDDGWQEAPLPPRKNAAAIAADGARYETNRAYRFVYSKTQGQRLDQIELNRALREGFIAFTAPLWAFELAPGDTFTMSSRRWGGASKLWEVESINLALISGKAGGAPRARCAITAREVDANIYDWSTSDEITITSGAVVQPDPLEPIGEADGNSGALSDGLLPGDTYYDKLDGYTLKTVVASTLSVTLNRYTNSKTRAGAGDVTSDAFTATVSGGSGTYEYVWEKYYGDGTVNSPTSNSTTFTIALGIGETKSGKFRLTVTDTTNNISAVVTCGFSGAETT